MALTMTQTFPIYVPITNKFDEIILFLSTLSSRTKNMLDRTNIYCKDKYICIFSFNDFN